ncbi:hypothetical protein LSTR_LSTR014744 [Laodelphax striatellus]|uniref:Uncharacterized protein n=1 Tax=Laodelphax striatellus TaxID=195883 RepID=A0A482XFB6_LAOST|nr:hypothetical protein LSTR_LSTR014744 [Laodelphax striatellus]
MFRTKKDVDRYAQDVLRRVKNERERNMRCYNIAVQYYKVRDLESTRRYVCMYLAFKDDSASAHKLLGQALEGLKQKEKALAQYRRSVELESNQPELILKICELICDQDVHVDADKARYWCERAEDLFPHDPVVFRLKERLLTNGSTNHNANFSKEFEDLISSELKSRPVDVNVHVRQLKLYVDTGRTEAAYAHAQQIEAKKLFAHELQWYDYLTTLYKIYYDKNLPDVADCEFFVNWTMAIERYVMLCLAENQNSPPKSITECGNAIYRFDEVLHKAYAMLGKCKSYGQQSLSVKRSADFLEHMSAQLCLHLATFIFKKAKNEQGNWNEATRSAAPLLLFALVLAQPSEEQNMGGTPLKLSVAGEPLKAISNTVPQWTDAALHRHCQAGHVLISLANDQRQQYVDKVLHSCYKNWRERLFQKLFTFEETKNGLSMSHFVNHLMFSSPPRSDSSILRYLDDVIVQIPKQVGATASIQPGSLHHLVWLGVQGMRHAPPPPAATLPQRMPLPPHHFHTHHLFAALAIGDSSCHHTAASHDTVNRLDVDSFLYAAEYFDKKPSIGLQILKTQ